MARYKVSQLTQYMIRMSKGTKKALLLTAQAIFEGIRKEGSPVSYPIDWDSDRQRKAYFASDGFGAGIPYQRTSTYVASGSVTAQPYGARLYKPHPAGAIGGTFDGWQSKIHRGRWIFIWDVVEREVNQLPKRIREQVIIEEGDLNANA